MSSTITGTEYFAALRRWADFWGDQKLPIPSFDDFLGLGASPLDIHWGNYTIEIEADAVRKIQLLNGPHWKTLLKARQVTQAIGLNRDHP